MKRILATLFLTLVSLAAFGQQTVLNVPSTDVLDKGKAYLRVDTAYFPEFQTATIAPNFIFGVGHNVEIGLNVDAFGIPGDNASRAIVPNIKWRFFNKNGFTGYIGDKLYFPTHLRPYEAGNYLYAASTYTFSTKTRVGAGFWNSQNVYAPNNRTGALLSLEQPINSKFTAAVDWQSGHAGNGYTTMGLMWFPTKRLMIIPAYQLGNSQLGHGNHGAVMFIGYALN